MARHLMVDIETGATTPNAVILTLGAVLFDPYSDEIFDTMYVKLNIEQQENLGRVFAADTLDWWERQDKVIMEDAFSENDRISIQDAIDEFHMFTWNCEGFWAQGPQFDYVILEDLYRNIGRRPSWKHFQVLDSRTLFTLADPEMYKENAHNSLADAIHQAVGVQTVMRKLGKTK